MNDDPLYVLSDENGDLFLSSAEVCRDSTSRVVLRDAKLWDAYADACRAANKARAAVESVLELIPQPVTPETLTSEQISEVAKWAIDNGRKGLHADSMRCFGPNASHGALRRI